MKRRALIVCPGRGSYDRACLGSLQVRGDGATAVIAACDAYRQAQGRQTIAEIDATEAYRIRLHVAGENASLLTFAAGMADLADLDTDRFDVVGVVGNSMGFYTALAASGALSLEDAIELVDTMGAYQAGNVIGGQILTPMSTADWQHSSQMRAEIDAVLADIHADGHHASWSIDLGGFAVLGGDKGGVKAMLERLPKHTRGARSFPIQLPLHSAFHTPLMADTSARAFADLGNLTWNAPQIPLVDGRGYVFRPRWADPAELRDYTLGHQVVAPFDFTTAVATALRHTGAEMVIALGPGNSLGGPLARILTAEGWAGCRSRALLDARQGSDAPILQAFGVSMQRKGLVP